MSVDDFLYGFGLGLAIASGMWLRLLWYLLSIDGVMERIEGTSLDRVMRTAAATLKRQVTADRRRSRAAELRRVGLSAPQIGIRMAQEEGRADRPYSERQVRKWLSAAARRKRVTDRRLGMPDRRNISLGAMCRAP